jgi:cytochrome c-type biogenesis protein CcmH
MRAIALAAMLGLATAAALAVEPDERLADPALEARARALSGELRCLVCQNQSIDDSGADLAHDLRVLLRERLSAGDTDAQVLQFMVRRYGDFILLKPPVKADTYVLWFGPFFVLALGALGAGYYLRRGRRAPQEAPTTLSADERRKLQKLLAEDGG